MSTEIMHANVFTSTNYHIECTDCKEYLTTMDTLRPSKMFCDSCGVEFSIIINSSGIDSKKTDCVELEKTGRKKISSLSLLKLDIDKPLFCVVPSYQVLNTDGKLEYSQEDKKFFYEEHTCPTNWMREVIDIVYDKETDNHDIVEHVKTVSGAETDHLLATGYFSYTSLQDYCNVFGKKAFED